MKFEDNHDIGNGIKKAVWVVIAIIIQIIWILWSVCYLRDKYQFAAWTINIIAVILVINIYSHNETASIKMPWIMLIMALPAFGMTMYLLAGWNIATVTMKKRYNLIDEQLFSHLPANEQVLSVLEEKDLSVANQSRYIQTHSKYPLYQNSDVTFHDDALKGLEAQLEALQQAKSFIFMEYHAIEDTESFAKIHIILKEKVKEGVEVRLIYDYVGSMEFIGNGFVKKMIADGIQCYVFNPANPALNLFLNNRDHRKITVIDGRIGFTGGYNLADEYFHIKEPYGHWLDTGICIEGEAVKNLTIAFLENWYALEKTDDWESELNRFLPDFPYTAREQGFVQPYADNPMDDEQVGENVYLNVLRSAQKYAYFITPYLIITDEMRSAFSIAAKSGVDIRIITPGIPDKKLIYSVTRSYYTELVQSGVRIFEYTPGFCHAKQWVSDDKTAGCGTINLDFRSLYHHFENGVFFYNCDAVHQIKAQFDELFDICEDVTENYRVKRIGLPRLKELFLRLIAPLL